MNKDRTPSPVQFLQCAALVAKVIISEDGKFAKSEIELANELLECSWNNNVTDFLHVIAGTGHAGVDVYGEGLAALTFKYEKSSKSVSI